MFCFKLFVTLITNSLYTLLIKYLIFFLLKVPMNVVDYLQNRMERFVCILLYSVMLKILKN